MYVALLMILFPLTYLLSYIPIIGGLANGLLYIVALLFTIVLASAVIATAYIFYRPLYVIAVFVMMFTFIVLTYLSVDKKGLTTTID